MTTGDAPGSPPGDAVEGPAEIGMTRRLEICLPMKKLVLLL